MREVMDMLHPRNVELPYVYDDLTSWGGSHWKLRDRKAKEA